MNTDESPGAPMTDSPRGRRSAADLVAGVRPPTPPPPTAETRPSDHVERARTDGESDAVRCGYDDCGAEVPVRAARCAFCHRPRWALEMGGRRRAIGERLVVGRDPEASPMASHLEGHPNVSRTHAEFTSDGDDLVVVDLGSTNGTTVNGDAVTPYLPASLHAGDRVRFGVDAEVVIVLGH